MASWDVESFEFGKRGFLSPEEILNQVKDTGKILVPSSNYIFPTEEAAQIDKIIKKHQDIVRPGVEAAINKNSNLPLTPDEIDLETNKRVLSGLGAYEDPEVKKYTPYLGRNKSDSAYWSKRFKNFSGKMGAVDRATWDIARDYEPRAYQALSRGIQDVYGFKPKHKIQDISKILAESMGVENLPIEIKYGDGWAGRTNNKVIQLNPESLHIFGREAVLAHELRHIKEKPYISDTTLGKPRAEGLWGLYDANNMPKLYKAKQGKDLQQFKKGGGFKESIDALDVLNFFEGKHFKTPFIKENLKRVARGLPIISAAGALIEPDIASATVGGFIPGGVEEAGRRSDKLNFPESEFDLRYTDYLKKLRRSK